MKLSSYLFDNGGITPRPIGNSTRAFPTVLGLSRRLRVHTARLQAFGFLRGVDMGIVGSNGWPLEKERLRDRLARAGTFRPKVLSAVSRRVPRSFETGREPVQVRRHGQPRQAVSRQRVWKRLRRGHRANRRPSARQAGPVREHDDQHMALPVLDAHSRLDLARRVRPQLRGSGSLAAAVDHVPGRRHLPGRGSERAALPHQFAHAARPHLRQVCGASGGRSQQRLRLGRPRLLRNRHAASRCM